MLADIFNVPIEVEINGKTYKAEYNFKTYAILESLTGKSYYKLYDLLMIENNLTLKDSVEIICCSFIKHHTTEEVAKIREYLQDNIHLIKELNNSIIGAFVLPILPPEIVNTINDVKKKIQEKLQNQQAK